MRRRPGRLDQLFSGRFLKVATHRRELIAVDGTRIKAVNNRDRNFTRATLERDPATASTTGWNATSNR